MTPVRLDHVALCDHLCACHLPLLTVPPEIGSGEQERIFKKLVRSFPHRPLSWLLLGSFLLGPLPPPSQHARFVKVFPLHSFPTFSLVIDSRLLSYV
jgi:hypothetical protein